MPSISIAVGFQSTLPRGERLSIGGVLPGIQNFNPRSHAGSDCRRRIFQIRFFISIHAPTRGATLRRVITDPQQINFNPRSHAGSDLYFKLQRKCIISIHAPTRGATWSMCTSMIHYDFNPRSHAGSDLLGRLLALSKFYFNPRSHAGSDPGPVARCAPGLIFQSTLPRGERPELGINSQTTDAISIHAPTRGATLFGKINGQFWWISIHAPTRGATAIGVFQSAGGEISIHAPTRGATGKFSFEFRGADISIHAPTRGATK